MSGRLLLDTHVLIWLQSDPERLSQTALQEVTRASNKRFFSVISFWEIVLKWKKGRLALAKGPEAYIEEATSLSKAETLPLASHHVYAVSHLPDIHNDPFDHLLIGQAIAEQMTLVTADPVVRSYPVSSIW